MLTLSFKFAQVVFMVTLCFLDQESIPSTRIAYVGYNLHYRAQGFYDNITKLNAIADTGKKP